MYPVFFGEILSKYSLDLTVGELEQDLLDMLRFYRNFDTTIRIVKGVVMPTYVRDMKQLSCKEQKREEKKRCPTLMVTMEWSEKEFQFISELSHIDHLQILEVISSIIKEHSDMTIKFQQDLFSGFFLPISQSSLMATFGSGAMQVSSGGYNFRQISI